MCPSLIQIGSKTAEKNCTNKQTNKQTDRHYENNGHLAVNHHRKMKPCVRHWWLFDCRRRRSESRGRSVWTEAESPRSRRAAAADASCRWRRRQQKVRDVHAVAPAGGEPVRERLQLPGETGRPQARDAALQAVACRYALPMGPIIGSGSGFTVNLGKSNDLGVSDVSRIHFGFGFIVNPDPDPIIE